MYILPASHRTIGAERDPASLPVLLSRAKGGVVGSAALSPGQPTLVETFDGRAGGRGVLAQLTGRWWWPRRRTTSDYLAWCACFVWWGRLAFCRRKTLGAWLIQLVAGSLFPDEPRDGVLQDHLVVMNTSSCCLTTTPEEDTFLLRRRLSLSQPSTACKAPIEVHRRQ